MYKRQVLNLAISRVGLIPADYTQAIPRALLVDLTLQQLSPESRDNNPNLPALPASNLTATSSPTATTQGATTQGATSKPIHVTEGTASSSITTAVTNPAITKNNTISPFRNGRRSQLF